MSLLTMTILLAAEEGEGVSLPMPTWAYGVIALGILIALALVTYSYRDVANRHRQGGQDDAHDDGGAHGGH